MIYIIKHQTNNYDWEFIFLGANIDAIGEASKLGIHPSRAANYVFNKDGIELNFSVLNKTIGEIRYRKNKEEVKKLLN